MSKAYDVTIGIPVYNVEHYIRRSLDSALNQQFQGSIELLILDDCSTDKSMNVVREIKENHPKGHHIRIINHHDNLGIGISRNEIIDNAQGKYLFFLDADDFIKDGMLSAASVIVATEQDHEQYPELIVGKTYIKLLFNVDGEVPGRTNPVFISAEDLVDVYAVNPYSGGTSMEINDYVI